MSVPEAVRDVVAEYRRYEAWASDHADDPRHDEERADMLYELADAVSVLADEVARSEPDGRYLSVYATTRHYGGPEEGGWWFNWDEPILCYAVADGDDDDEVEARREALRAEWSEKIAHGDIYSVLDGVDVWVGLESEPFEFRSVERPRYS